MRLPQRHRGCSWVPWRCRALMTWSLFPHPTGDFTALCCSVVVLLGQIAPLPTLVPFTAALSSAQPTFT